MSKDKLVTRWAPGDAEKSDNEVERVADDLVQSKVSVISEGEDAEEDELLVFSDAAANKVLELITEEENDNLKLRVFITGGGCSGFQYGFTFDEEVNDDDFFVEKNGVTLLIDAMSMQYLDNAEIDYKEDLNGSQFVIRNPNAVTTCGCGSSFSLE
jgi:iron-sulfur cluster insertion protein